MNSTIITHSIKIAGLIVILLFSGSTLSAQDDFRRYDPTEIDELKSDKSYQYDRMLELERKEKESSSTSSDRIENNGSEENNDTGRKRRNMFNWGGGMFGGIINVLTFVLIAAIVILIIYLIWKTINERTTRSDKSVDLDQSKEYDEYEEYEDIYEMDLEFLLSQALKDGSYRWAIRYWYLIILKKLDEANMIQWEIEKTNYDYISELKNPKVQDSLRKLTWIFEYTWYGELVINEREYKILESDFHQFNYRFKTNTKKA